jgi:hypothetical protein
VTLRRFVTTWLHNAVNVFVPIGTAMVVLWIYNAIAHLA